MFSAWPSIKTGLTKLSNSRIETLAQAKLTYLSAAFSLTSDIALATYGGALKRKEMVSGRFADAFSWIYLGCGALKRHHDAKERGMEPILEWSIQTACHNAHEAVLGNIDNLPNPLIRFLIKILSSPLGLRFKLPDDKLTGTVAASILDGDKRRETLSKDVFIPGKDDPALGRLEQALKLAEGSLPLKKKLRIARKEGKINARYGEMMIKEGLEAKIITDKEATELRKYDKLVLDVINVDDFDVATYKTLK